MFGLKKKLPIKYLINTRFFLVVLFSLSLLISFSQVPYGLSSNPSARPTAFLDFDGQTVDDIYWRPFNGDSIIFCKPSLLSNASMIKVFNHVAEDFRAFNINITTDSAVYFAAPITKRTRVIITPTFRWYGSAGGVAYVESFRWGLNTPCFVFDTLLSLSDKRVAEATSHEIGHTLGLYHQARYLYEGTDTCRFSMEYHPGRGSGEIAWAPIMGNSYDRNMGLWHIGINSFGCSFFQNDLNIITNVANGITYRSDDHGNTINSSTLITPINGNYSVGGIINDSTDNDFFQFQLNVPGRFTANINPFNSGPPNIRHGSLLGVVNFNGNVDLEVSLFRNNTQLRVYNPLTSLGVVIDTLLEPGNYYLKVNNVSNSNIFKSTMIGSYTITGSFGGSVVVPVQYIDFNGSNINDKHKLTWQIVSDEPIDIIKLEVSEDGLNFRELISLKGDVKEYEYIPFKNKTLYYRLVVKTKSQLSFTSRTIVIRNKSKFKIVSTTIKDNIIINTESHYDWRLFDMSGKKILNGRMLAGFNKISLNGLSGGIYILQIMSENNNYSEKIIKL